MFELLQQRWRAEQAAMVERAACRRQAITGALSMLARYQVHRAYLFGSVQRGECREGADIDLYVEPLPVAKYWQLLHELEEATDFDIDLHAPGDDAAFIATIKDRGELIYESIARFFENDLRAGSWHRDLLKRRSRGSGRASSTTSYTRRWTIFAGSVTGSAMVTPSSSTGSGSG